ncbi:hypothetical protein [Vibrio alginolyticus]|uniref:Tail completion protein n=1 Tax=Vibrio phage vB_VpaS_HCMJ TaxID=2601627 RepID=A0A5C2IH19_9CAUD|nr:hypothetical protein [Vibrio alginolyticus]QEP53409.1 hypothetical protein HCMJ_41 [Vibrio phage vB_VpaS_HCMJ]UCW44037.1 hypothetical protein [Vibrio phage F23s1]
MANFSDIPKDLKHFAFTLQANTETRQREVALTITRELMQRNPKKTGRSAGNWQVGMNRPKLIAQAPPVSERASDEELSKSSKLFVQKQLSKAINDITKGTLRGDDPVIYISNTINYVVYLNTTRPSPQAAPGWIEASIRFGADSTKGVKLT